MFDRETVELATAVLDACRARGWRVAAAESCTGGLVAAALTAIPGASDVLDRGFVTYSNKSKIELLGVPEPTLAEYGAVSSETALAMATGAVVRAGADLAVSVTGLAGPGGASADKPIGLVYLGVATKSGSRAERRVFPGDRSEIRRVATVFALKLLLTEANAR